jgi:hypothetical protein
MVLPTEALTSAEHRLTTNEQIRGRAADSQSTARPESRVPQGFAGR